MYELFLLFFKCILKFTEYERLEMVFASLEFVDCKWNVGMADILKLEVSQRGFIYIYIYWM